MHHSQIYYTEGKLKRLRVLHDSTVNNIKNLRHSINEYRLNQVQQNEIFRQVGTVQPLLLSKLLNCFQLTKELEEAKTTMADSLEYANGLVEERNKLLKKSEAMKLEDEQNVKKLEEELEGTEEDLKELQVQGKMNAQQLGPSPRLTCFVDMKRKAGKDTSKIVMDESSYSRGDMAPDEEHAIVRELHDLEEKLDRERRQLHEGERQERQLKEVFEHMMVCRCFGCDGYRHKLHGQEREEKNNLQELVDMFVEQEQEKFSTYNYIQVRILHCHLFCIRWQMVSKQHVHSEREALEDQVAQIEEEISEYKNSEMETLHKRHLRLQQKMDEMER